MQRISTVTVHADIQVPSVPMDVTKAILESKRPRIGEIELTLFENCNIECDFCFHDKKSTVGMSRSAMFEKLSIIEAHLIKHRGKVDLMQINILGGELFQDRYMEQLCEDYYALMVEVRKLYDKHNHVLKVVWVSNFLFVKRDIVRDLIERLNAIDVPSTLIVSYDFTGRPMSRNYKKNIEHFQDCISSVNAVATRNSVRHFIDKDDSYFDWLYQTFDIYFDSFIPDKGADAQIPQDSLLYEFHCYIIDHYPKINPIREMIESPNNNHMHCLSLNKVTIFPNDTTSNCRWHRYDQSDFNTELNMDDNSGMMQNFVDTNGCLSCEYFSRCGMRCFTQWDWSNRNRDMDTCMMKAVFNRLTKGIEWSK